MTTDIAALLREHPVIDGHNDLLWTAREKAGYDFERLELTVSRQFLRRIMDATGGNPLFALEIGRSLVEQGAQNPS